MQKPTTIKNTTFGSGRPVVCVSVTARTAFDIISEIRELVANKVQMIEWRVDYFEGITEAKNVTEVLSTVKPLLTDTVFLFTFRTKEEGGNITIPEERIIELNETAAKSGVIDIIDLEFFQASDSKREIKRFKDLGIKVIASHHDFEQTPEESVMKMLLEYMREGGADIVKLAVMPQSFEDVLRLISVTNEMHNRYKELPIVTMSMGKLGMISRMCGEISGSCITFGAYHTASAPGQINMNDLNTVLDIIHSNN